MSAIEERSSSLHSVTTPIPWEVWNIMKRDCFRLIFKAKMSKERQNPCSRSDD